MIAVADRTAVEAAGVSPLAIGFGLLAWSSVAAFVVAISWDGFASILAKTFWVAVVVGAFAGLAARVLGSWVRRHRSGAVAMVWWGTAGSIVALGVLSVVATWTYVALLLALVCLMFGLVLGLPGGLAVASLVRLLAARRGGRAPSLHE